MAKRKTKAAPKIAAGRPRIVKTKKTSDHFIKSLDPKDPDTTYWGEEPYFDQQPERRDSTLTKSFSWYSRFYGRKDAKELLASYLDNNDKSVDAKKIRKVDDNELICSYGWLARMSMRGLVLNENEQERLTTEITRLINMVENPEEKTSLTGKSAVPKEEKEKPNRPSIQDILREKAVEASGELEGMFDDFLSDGAKTNHSFKPMEEIAKHNIAPQHISYIVDVWKRKQSEFDEVQLGTDVQLVQAYKHYTKTQIKNILKFIDQVLTDLNSYISIKKAAKAPRKKKAVPVEKIVSKLKYLKEFKDEKSKIDLTSVHPVKLHGASEAWVYDTAKRKLHHYIADEYSKTFTVKGNTLLGFDTNQSEVKTLRKPAEQLKEIMGTRPGARKFFKDIKSVATTPNGRFNENIIILKAF